MGWMVGFGVWWVAVASSVASGLNTGKVVRKSPKPWVFAQRFCFRGGSEGGVDKAGTFKYRVKSYGLWMLIFTESEFSTFKKIQESDYSDMPMHERFNRAESVVWVGHNESDRVTKSESVVTNSTYMGLDVRDTSFWAEMWQFYAQGTNVDSTVPWSETRGEYHYKADARPPASGPSPREERRGVLTRPLWCVRRRPSGSTSSSRTSTASATRNAKATGAATSNTSSTATGGRTCATTSSSSTAGPRSSSSSPTTKRASSRPTRSCAARTR